MNMRAGFLLLIAGMFFPVSSAVVSAHQLCPERPACKGCGCKGGPGYRSMVTGKCVGFKQLKKACGNPPTLRCVFENAPGTGRNKKCATHVHKDKKK